MYFRFSTDFVICLGELALLASSRVLVNDVVSNCLIDLFNSRLVCCFCGGFVACSACSLKLFDRGLELRLEHSVAKVLGFRDLYALLC